MASGAAQVTVVGNLAADPELAFLPSGVPVTKMTVISTERAYDAESKQWVDRNTTSHRIVAWRRRGENAAESLRKGDRCVVIGRLLQRSYDKDGETKYVLEVIADEVCASLEFATAAVTKNKPSGSGSGRSVAPDEDVPLVDPETGEIAQGPTDGADIVDLAERGAAALEEQAATGTTGRRGVLRR